jgi:hypothetical protein
VPCRDAGRLVFSVGDALADSLVRAGGVVVLLILGQTASRCAAPRIGTRSRSSRRRVPTRRSQVAFIRGAWTAVRKIVVPADWKTASNEAVTLEPRSRIRNLKGTVALVDRGERETGEVTSSGSVQSSLASGSRPVGLENTIVAVTCYFS